MDDDRGHGTDAAEQSEVERN